METYNDILNSIEDVNFSLNDDQKVRILALILYPNESNYSLTVSQLDKVRNILNEFK